MLSIGFTSTSNRADAERIAERLVAAKLAACVQIDGPITSVYGWEDKIERAEEYRLTVKFLTRNQYAVEAGVLADHPYDTPEWVVIRAEHVTEKYLSWARANSQDNRF